MKKDGSWETAALGVERRLVALGQNIMTMEVRFTQGAIGALHQHPHEQVTTVLNGRFRFQINQTFHEISTGDVLMIPSSALHGVETLEAGTLIDTFQPIREDLLE